MLVGTMLLAVALLHLAVGTYLYRGALGEIARDGVIATVSDFGDGATTLWFLFSGLCLLVLGACVREGELRGHGVPRVLPVGLLLLAFANIVPMPVTGAWLFLPVAWLSYRRRQ